MQSKNIDYSIFFIVLSLVVFGMIMISSVSVYPSFKVTSLMVTKGLLAEPNNYFYLLKNITHVFLGFLLFAFVVKTPYSFFERYAKHIFIAGIFSLVLVLFIGTTYNGARGWINVPFLPFSLQPVEFMKFGLVIYLAYFLKKRRSQIADFFNGFLPYMFNFGIIMFLLILQPDFGSILICTPLVIAMFFVWWGNTKHLLASFGVFMIFALSIYGLGKHSTTTDRNSLSYITDRVDNFLADNKNAIQNKTINFQTEQGLIAIGSGGFFGLGFGKSIQKFGYLPEVEGDFIFSVISEELGFLGVFFLVSLYLYIGWRGFLIAEATQDLFGKYVATGITTLILSQAFINIGVNLNILPLTGITLPFISYGGSSLLSLMLAVGVLLNISRTADFTRVENNMGLFRRNKVR
ncbi:MAG: hypothetical protein ACD_78C00439G0006 [uncultured bacterium (gcode 4)]|uniref:Probable peptidoglycan glycosyltransferase FtsW n=1 Tax=uncultured bacterium (gcode 4) TaxID=1234023 RepID=K1YA85_9BACT|nr:MAG: hypothetical protein ACD_78C00439G0006 [uncultured bacterium (gcode 4)]